MLDRDDLTAFPENQPTQRHHVHVRRDQLLQVLHRLVKALRAVLAVLGQLLGVPQLIDSAVHFQRDRVHTLRGQARRGGAATAVAFGAAPGCLQFLDTLLVVTDRILGRKTHDLHFFQELRLLSQPSFTLDEDPLRCRADQVQRRRLLTSAHLEACEGGAIVHVHVHLLYQGRDLVFDVD